MAVQYKLIPRKDLHKGAGENDKLFYAQAKSSGTCDVERLCGMISERATVSSADVKAVLDSLNYVMRVELSDGKIVQLGEFGNFRLTFGSEGKIEEKEFSSANIRRPKLKFSPGKTLRNMIKTVDFVKCTPEVIVKEIPCDKEHVFA